MQNAEEHAHGLIAPDLGMGAYRNSVIIPAMTGRAVYPVEERIAIQALRVPEHAEGGPVTFTARTARHRRATPPIPAFAGSPIHVSVYWGMQDATVHAVRRPSTPRSPSGPHHDAFLGRVDGDPGLPGRDLRPGAQASSPAPPRAGPGDVGMHLLVAPPGRGRTPGSPGGLRGRHACALRRPAARRVVVEPDERNDRHRPQLNAEAGFAACWARCRSAGEDGPAVFLHRWRGPGVRRGAGRTHRRRRHLHARRSSPRAHRHLVAKAIAEFSHERILHPQPGRLRLAGSTPPAGDTTSRSPPRRSRSSTGYRPGDVVARNSTTAGRWTRWRSSPGWPARWASRTAAATYLEEIAATLAGAAWKHHHDGSTVAALVHARFQDIEAAMTEGHPGFVANNGRIGFGPDDHEAYAPEAGNRSGCLARRPARERVQPGAGLTEADLYAGELDPATGAVRRRLRSLGLDPADYRYCRRTRGSGSTKVAVTFAPDVARRATVPLGSGPTTTARSSRSGRSSTPPARPALREDGAGDPEHGLPARPLPAYMRPTPAINDWVAGARRGRRDAARLRVLVLRELAAVGYTGDAYHRLVAFRVAYQKMIAALWRESPVPRLATASGWRRWPRCCTATPPAARWSPR